MKQALRVVRETPPPAVPAVREFLESGEVADILRVKPRQVQRLVRLGRLRAAAKPGAKLLFKREDVDAYLARAKPNARVVAGSR